MNILPQNANNKEVPLIPNQVSFAQSFLDSKLYIGTSRPVLMTDGTTEYYPSLVSSIHEEIACTAEILKQYGLALRKPPLIVEGQRWSTQSVQGFLNGEEANIKDAFLFLQSIFNRYVSFPEPIWYEIIPLWIIGTYIHQGLPAYPYLLVSGARGSGKSRLLEIISLLSFNGVLTTTATPAVIFRYVDSCHATLCLDEAERLKVGRGNEDVQTLISVLNQGYRAGAVVLRCSDGKKNWKLESFLAYSPKAFAGIAELEPTLASRCIAVTMIQSSDPSFSREELSLTNPQFQQGRDMLYNCAMRYHQGIILGTQFVETVGLMNRSLELWRPLISIADQIDPVLAESIRKFAVQSESEKDELYADTTLADMLSALDDYLEQNKEDKFIPLTHLASIFADYDYEKFGWLVNNERHGSAHRWITQKLRHAGVINTPSVSGRYKGGKPIKGHYLESEKIKNRLPVYLKSVTTVTNVTESNQGVTNVTKVTNSSHSQSLFTTAKEVFNKEKI